MPPVNEMHVYAGTAGHSAWFSDDDGITWVHPNSHSGLYLEARVWSLASHAGVTDALYAGTDMGVFRWSEADARWTHLPSPMEDVWALAVDPRDPDVLIAGTRPAAFFRSRDAGATWLATDAPGLSGFSDVNMGPTRVTQIIYDPLVPGAVWASVEIGGIFHSADDGASWQLRANGLVSADVHGIAVMSDAEGRHVVLATTNRGLHRSEDHGHHWTLIDLPSHWQYTRAIVPHPDGSPTVFVTNGNGPPGNSGRLLRSGDAGKTWRQVQLPGEINSTVWTLAVHPADPSRLFMGTNLGQLFRSLDGGETWERLPHEFGELRTLFWRPLPAGTRKASHALTRSVVKVPNIASAP
ncbi:MAG: hypothetical protein U1F54_20320 [Burkholderiales bacterium]